jgi:hypothetical protein
MKYLSICIPLISLLVQSCGNGGVGSPKPPDPFPGSLKNTDEEYVCKFSALKETPYQKIIANNAKVKITVTSNGVYAGGTTPQFSQEILFSYDAVNSVKSAVTTQFGTISMGSQSMTSTDYRLEIPDKQNYVIDAQISINKNDPCFNGNNYAAPPDKCFKFIKSLSFSSGTVPSVLTPDILAIDQMASPFITACL